MPRLPQGAQGGPAAEGTRPRPGPSALQPRGLSGEGRSWPAGTRAVGIPQSRPGGPVPSRTAVEEAGEEPQHQADHGGSERGRAAPRCHRPRGTSRRDTGTPGRRSHGHGRAGLHRGGVCRPRSSPAPRVVIRLFSLLCLCRCGRHCTLIVVGAVRLWGSCCGTELQLGRELRKGSSELPRAELQPRRSGELLRAEHMLLPSFWAVSPALNATSASGA